MAWPGLFRDGDQFHIDQRLPALLAARQAPRPAALWSSLQAGTATNRRLAPADPRGGETVRRAGTGSRRVRTADKGLWRHAFARARQLSRHRGARDPPRFGGPDP